MIDDAETMVSGMGDMNLLPETTKEDFMARLALLRNEHTRGMAVNASNTKEDYDDMIGQGDMQSGKQCKLSDIVFFESLDNDIDMGIPPGYSMLLNNKLGNNRCDVFRAKDLDGNTVNVSERRENMCERVCEVKGKGNPKGGPNEDQSGKSKARVFGRLADVISLTGASMQSMPIVTKSIANLGFPMSGSGLSAGFLLSSADSCAFGSTGPSQLQLDIRSLDGAISGLSILIAAEDVITEILGLTKDLIKAMTNQTAAGFNTSAAATVPIGLFHFSKGLASFAKDSKSILGARKNILKADAAIESSSKADTVKNCTKEIKDDTGAIKDETAGLKLAIAGIEGKVNSANTEIAAIRTDLAALKLLLKDTRDLLLTPTGRREEFPN